MDDTGTQLEAVLLDVMYIPGLLSYFGVKESPVTLSPILGKDYWDSWAVKLKNNEDGQYNRVPAMWSRDHSTIRKCIPIE